MSRLARLLIALAALLLPAANARLAFPNCAKRDWGDVSEGKHLVLPQFVLPFGSSGRIDIPNYCEAKGLGYSCGRHRVEACNTNRDGAKPSIEGHEESSSPVWVKCRGQDGCYPGGVSVQITLYCTEVCL